MNTMSHTTPPPQARYTRYLLPLLAATSLVCCTAPPLDTTATQDGAVDATGAGQSDGAKLPDAKLPDAKLPDAKLPDTKPTDTKLPDTKLTDDTADSTTGQLTDITDTITPPKPGTHCGLCAKDSDCGAMLGCAKPQYVCKTASELQNPNQPACLADCRLGSRCSVDGKCGLSNGACVVVNSADCAKSSGCSDKGACALLGSQCRPTKVGHCLNSWNCKSGGYCSLVAGKCVTSWTSGGDVYDTWGVADVYNGSKCACSAPKYTCGFRPGCVKSCGSCSSGRVCFHNNCVNPSATTDSGSWVIDTGSSAGNDAGGDGWSDAGSICGTCSAGKVCDATVGVCVKQTCTLPTSLPQNTHVNRIVDIRLLKTGVGCDLNGDGKANNALGTLLNVFPQVNNGYKQSIYAGKFVMLFAPDAWKTNKSAFEIAVLGGKVAAAWLKCDPAKTSTCKVMVDPASYDRLANGTGKCPLRTKFPAAKVAGNSLTSGPAVGTVHVPLSLLGLPIQLPIRQAQVTGAVSDLVSWKTMPSGKLCGLVRMSDLEAAIDGLPAAMLIQTGFDKKTIKSLLNGLLKEDIDTDGDGKADVLSVAFSITTMVVQINGFSQP